MIVKLLTEHHLQFPSLIKGCTGSSESTLVKMPYCWKSHALARFIRFIATSSSCSTTELSILKFDILPYCFNNQCYKILF